MYYQTQMVGRTILMHYYGAIQDGDVLAWCAARMSVQAAGCVLPERRRGPSSVIADWTFRPDFDYCNRHAEYQIY
jgi:hypothetical protein